MSNWIDLSIIAAYLIGTTLFGCSFYFRKRGDADGARTFMTGGGHLPTWAIALSVFATHVSSISFLALPEGAYGPENWQGWVNSLTVPLATVVAAIWFVPFYRKSTSVSAYSFLEKRFGLWARIYASACFLLVQSMRSGIILLLLAILVNQLLGFSCESIIVVTGLATLIYSMMGGFSAVVWADAIQSLILIVGTLVCVTCLVVLTPNFSANAMAAWDAGKLSLGSMSLSDWGSNTFWVMFTYSICVNLQNFGVDQCYTQRYIAAKDSKAAVKSILGSACLYVTMTLLFTGIGTLLWMYAHANPGEISSGMRAAAVFPWFIVHKLPVGVSGLLVAAIIAAAMSTVAATLNSGSTVLWEDYWKRFSHRRDDSRDVVFLRVATGVLAVVSIGIAFGVVRLSGGASVLSSWWLLQSVFSGGMLGLFIIGVFAKRTGTVQALVAAFCGFLALAWVAFGQKVFPLPLVFHVNMALVFGTLAIVVVGFLPISCLNRRGRVLG